MGPFLMEGTVTALMKMKEKDKWRISNEIPATWGLPLNMKPDNLNQKLSAMGALFAISFH